METITSEAQWLEKFASISQEIQLEDIFEKSKYDLTISLEYSDDDDSEDDSDDINNHKDDHSSVTASSVINKRLIKISPLFAGQPKFESICRDQSTQFVLSGLTSYRFLFPNPDDPIEKFHKKADDLECTIHLWGHNLSEITIYEYPSSKIFQIINTACPNLRKYDLQLKEIESEDFENIFSNMAHLEELDIYWNCENSTLPTSLVKSIEQVGGTLKKINLMNFSEVRDLCLPDSFASVFPRLIVLEQLFIHSFGHLNQALIQSVAKIGNLLVLVLDTREVEDPQSNSYPIGNLKNLKVLEICTDCGVTDELLINLSNNAKNLIALSILGTNITDNGIMALSKCTQLIKLDLDLCLSKKNNEFITDQSVEYLFFNKKLKELNISNCIEITDSAVLKLVKNSTNLRELYPKKTTVTVELAKELRNITEFREKYLWIYVPREQHDCFNSFESDKLFFVTYLK